MATYGELKADIASWLVAADVQSQIPSFVRLAEHRIRFGIVAEGAKRADFAGAVRVRDMQRRARAPGQDSEYLAMPTGALEFRYIAPVVEGIVDRPLDQLSDDAFIDRLRSNRSGRVSAYTLSRNEIRFDVALAEESQVEMLYYVPYAPLAADTDTNWLLENAYSVYLFGALAEADPFLQDDERAPMWEAKYAAAVVAVNEAERRAETSRGDLRTSVRALP